MFAAYGQRTVALTDVTAEETNVYRGPFGDHFIEVDPVTGVAYAVEFGRPLHPDELSPWRRTKKQAAEAWK